MLSAVVFLDSKYCIFVSNAQTKSVGIFCVIVSILIKKIKLKLMYKGQVNYIPGIVNIIYEYSMVLMRLLFSISRLGAIIGVQDVRLCVKGYERGIMRERIFFLKYFSTTSDCYRL